VSGEYRTSEPHDRLTRLCAAMTEALDAALEQEAASTVPSKRDDLTTPKCIVFLQDDQRGGLQLHGYEDDTEALADLFLHLRAIFRSQGKDLNFMPMPEGPPEAN
jgi:hypothetical protein